MVSPVVLIFFMMLESVSMNLERRSMLICSRSDVISDISLMLSSWSRSASRIVSS